MFYDADGKLLPPLPEIVIVEGSPIDQAYSDAGIEHGVTSAQSLIAKGYCNPFLLKLATPAESDLVRDLKAKLAAGREAASAQRASAGFAPGMNRRGAAVYRDTDCAAGTRLGALRRRGHRSRHGAARRFQGDAVSAMVMNTQPLRAHRPERPPQLP